VSDSGPLVSVVVPTRNSARTIEACLCSVRFQTYQPIELIVVDNGSTDGTLEVAWRLADTVDSHGPERSSQRNWATSLAHGDFLLFVDSDMTLDARVVSDCVDEIRRSSSPAVIIPERSVGEGFWARCRALERSCYVGDDSIEAARFYTRKALEASGGYDETLVAGEDWDLSIRIAKGAGLPRIGSYISHDEGKLRLTVHLAKKRYYAASSLRYLQKHGTSSLNRGNLIFRPAFLRNWRRLARHPVSAAGVFLLKTLESAAVVSGVVAEWVRRRKDQQTKPAPTGPSTLR
jgi:glycosyltransferase involved in cell wall biosynthesis